MDAIQQALEQHHADPDLVPKAELEAAIDALAAEWKRQLRSLLQSPSADEVDDMLQAAFEELVLAPLGVRARVLAPPDAGAPGAWRRTVLRRWWIDRIRKKRRRDHVVKGIAQGWSPQTEKDQWSQEKEERAGARAPDLRLVDPVAPRDREVLEEDLTAAIDERRRLAAMVPELPVRRRVLVVLAMGGDATPFAAELASLLDDDVEQVLARIHHATVSGHDASHDYLSEAMVRVVYPPPKPLASAKEAARKALENAIRDLKGRAR